MAERIVSRSFSKQGLDNWDKIFKKSNNNSLLKAKKALKDQQVNPMIPKIIPSECKECHRLDGTHDQDCRNYL